MNYIRPGYEMQREVQLTLAEYYPGPIARLSTAELGV